ncbi:MAG: FxsA family protein [Candidatus Thioglobus sp.]|nr:FxsA family protein [Candidatus Thioglobus sp.]
MLFPIFVIITLLEIYILANVGSAIGGFSTVLLVIITALIGSILLKSQGFSTLKKMQEKTAKGQAPAFEMLEGVAIIISGILLLTPGFITDFVGLLGLMPWSRKILIDKISNKTQQFSQRNNPKNQPQNQQNNTIEGEFWED